jgi:hypothetical protein
MISGITPEQIWPMAAVAYAAMWCINRTYACRTIRDIARHAINAAKPCDLAAVLGALPEVTRHLTAVSTDGTGGAR